jgi:hypothetical protein
VALTGDSELKGKVTSKIEENLGIIGAGKSSFRKVGMSGEVRFDLSDVLG